MGTSRSASRRSRNDLCSATESGSAEAEVHRLEPQTQPILDSLFVGLSYGIPRRSPGQSAVPWSGSDVAGRQGTGRAKCGNRIGDGARIRSVAETYLGYLPIITAEG